MTILKTLKITSTPKSAQVRRNESFDEKVVRTMIEGLDRQLLAYEAAQSGREYKIKLPGKAEKERTVRPLWFEADQVIFFNVKYGNRFVPLDKDGNHTIEVGALEDVPKVIERLKQAVEAGELNEILKKVAVKSRSDK